MAMIKCNRWSLGILISLFAISLDSLDDVWPYEILIGYPFDVLIFSLNSIKLFCFTLRQTNP